ncbi:unnamed protein product, partial [Prorocentrum cordatum]
EQDEDCKPEERKQQWYDWEGGDAGTFVCKRNAKLPVGLLQNVSAQDLLEKPWVSLLPALGPLAGKGGAAPAAEAALAQPLELKVDGLVAGKPGAAAPPAKEPKVEPRFGGILGSLF